ncbi:MAG: regulator [Rhodomicrobium sp.]
MIKFDDSNITWRTLDWLPHISFFVYDVDERAGIVDVIFKFAANQKVMLHTHHAPYITFVIQGELRFYYPDGRFKEVRRCGSYVRGSVTGEPQMEGGGDQDAIVFFSNRNVTGNLYEFFDEQGKQFKMLGIADFRDQLDQEISTGETRKVTAQAA